MYPSVIFFKPRNAEIMEDLREMEEKYTWHIDYALLPFLSCPYCFPLFPLPPSSYPDDDQLQTVYSTYLGPVLHHSLSSHPVWGATGRVHALTNSMVQVYQQVSTCTCHDREY